MQQVANNTAIQHKPTKELSSEEINQLGKNGQITSIALTL